MVVDDGKLGQEFGNLHHVVPYSWITCRRLEQQNIMSGESKRRRRMYLPSQFTVEIKSEKDELHVSGLVIDAAIGYPAIDRIFPPTRTKKKANEISTKKADCLWKILAAKNLSRKGLACRWRDQKNCSSNRQSASRLKPQWKREATMQRNKSKGLFPSTSLPVCECKKAGHRLFHATASSASTGEP